MTQLLWIVGILLAVCFLYFSFRGTFQYYRLRKKLDQNQAEFKKSLEEKEVLGKQVQDLEKKINYMLEDPITNLLGWKIFEDRLNQNIKESERYELILGILFVDIDDFKVINDALGYEVSDALLREMGARLKSCVRAVDSVSRFTKDTFVILLTQLAKPETAAIVAQRILQSLSEPFQIQNRELFITASIGIATYPADGKGGQELLRSAGQALHLAKEKGKHFYQFYQEKMFVRSQRELALATSLNRESILNEVVLYFQPIINTRTEAIFGMDALVHWQHPTTGLIGPHELFAFAERQRKSNLISEWLIRTVCKQFLKWRSIDFNPEFVGIPISIKQLENSHFIYKISQLVQELKFKPEWLLLEIQDSSTNLPFEVLEKAFNMLNFIGVKISINNFDSGSFSLYHLKSFPINYLFLDPILISDIETNKKSVLLLESVINLAKNMALEVIICGVQTDEQINILKKLGCYLMEGTPLGEPILESEVTEKIAAT